MKIKDVENRIDATYNTIKNFVEKDKDFYEKIDGVLHVTEKGLVKLEEKYGVRSEIITDDNKDFYKNQVLFLKQQVEENRKYNEMFMLQIESKDIEKKKLEEELNEARIQIKEIEEEKSRKELEVIEWKHQLELEKNKSILQKIFGKTKS